MLLIWDFDETLGYRRDGKFSAVLQEVIRRAREGLDVPIEEIRPFLQSCYPWHTPERPHRHIRSADQWWEMLYPAFERVFAHFGFAGQEARAMAREARAVYTDPARWALYDDTLPALALLSARGWRHVVLSNHVPELRAIVRHLGLAPHLAGLFNSAETGYEKPHPRAFEIVLQRFPGARRVWMIGDSLAADVEGARRVGIPAILVRKRHEGVEYCCDSLLEVASIV